MSEGAPAPTPEATETEAAPDTGVDHEAEAAKWKELARKHEERAKANAAAAKELDQLRRQSMTDLEKAVDEARTQGRADGIREMGGRLVAAEVRAAAAGRLDADQLATLIEGINLAAFVDEAGDVDTAKVTRFVDGIVPKAPEDNGGTPMFPDLGQGARGANNLPLGSDPLERTLRAKLGIR